jgi:hypothetical protein
MFEITQFACYKTLIEFKKNVIAEMKNCAPIPDHPLKYLTQEKTSIHKNKTATECHKRKCNIKS